MSFARQNSQMKPRPLHSCREEVRENIRGASFHSSNSNHSSNRRQEQQRWYPTELIGKTHLTVVDVLQSRVEQRSGLRHQLTLLHSVEVFHGEEQRLVQQVSRKWLELGQHPAAETQRHIEDGFGLQAAQVSAKTTHTFSRYAQVLSVTHMRFELFWLEF